MTTEDPGTPSSGPQPDNTPPEYPSFPPPMQSQPPQQPPSTEPYQWQQSAGQPPRPARQSHKTRNIVLGIIGGIVVISVIAAVAASGGKTPSGTPNADGLGNTPTPAQASSPAVPDNSVTDPQGQVCTALDAKGYCPGDDPSPSLALQQQEQTWANGVAHADLQTLSTDLNTLAGYVQAGDIPQEQTECAALDQDANGALADENHDPNPDSAIHSSLILAYTEYTEAAMYCSEITSQYDTADITSMDTFLQQASTDITNATTQLKADMGQS